MALRPALIVLVILSVTFSAVASRADEVIELGRWTPETISALQGEVAPLTDPGQKVAGLSAAFLGTPYRANTLIGSAEQAEQFVLNLAGVDCFTLLDYVEALRRTSDFERFREALQQIRYRDGQVSFLSRNHFFSDWGEADSDWQQNLTAVVGGDAVRSAAKHLNKKPDGGLYLPGYPVREREILFIPSEAINSEMLGRLHNGDYLGFYSDLPGLDVSHTGILIRKGDTAYLRHASSRSATYRVIDEELLPYLKKKRGLIVYRPAVKK